VEYAASCDAIYAAPSSSVGSIGTYMAAVDDSRAWEMEGLELKIVRDGPFKAMGHPGKKWTAEEEGFLQERLDFFAKGFKDHVRSHRDGLSDDAMQGQCHTASHAPEGLIDGTYRDLESLLMAEWDRMDM